MGKSISQNRYVSKYDLPITRYKKVPKWNPLICVHLIDICGKKEFLRVCLRDHRGFAVISLNPHERRNNLQ